MSNGFYSDIGIILLDIKVSEDINFSRPETENSILGINHEGVVVWQYEVSSSITSIRNIVIYPDGRVWTGPILVGVENRAEWIVLTEEALRLLKDPSKFFTFDDPIENKRPTVLAKLSDSSINPLCNLHQCNGKNCPLDGKFPNNSPGYTIF